MSTLTIGLALMAIGTVVLLVLGFLYLTRQETNEVKRIFREMKNREEEK